MEASDYWPLFGLRIRAGERLELRPMTDEDLAAAVEVALDGIHDPSWTPFLVDWASAPPERLVPSFFQYHWGKRAEFGPDAWTLDFGVWWDGRLVGTQGISTSDYLITRTGETGSWLGREFQGQGIGTTMRRALCIFMFDHLGASTITSSAFIDNPASLGVSRKVGYRPNGIETKPRRGEAAASQQLLLLPEDLDRGGVVIEVAGLAAVRRLIGLEPSPS
jgi:RimJ/RimL family protein N-acetyltransferase